MIIYIVAGALALGGISVGGVFAIKKINANKVNNTTETTTQQEEPATFGYPIVEEPSVSEEPLTNELGEIIEIVTNEEGSTVEIVYATDKNGEIVTKANGEKVTSTRVFNKPTTTKKPTVKPTQKPVKNNGIKDGAKVDSNSTAQVNPDGSMSIVKSDGTVALSYSYDAVGNYFYTDDNPWQRNFGFNRLYDMGAAFTVMYYDTVRIKYSYGQYDWMIQMWKGQYGLIFVGSEIGLYYKEKTKTTDHYNCATEAMELNMQMTLYREGRGELFTRPYAPHWWITAFVPGKLTKFSDRSELTMIGKIEFKSEGERKAFCTALEKCKDIDGNRFKYASQISKNTPERYTFRGNTVDLVWRFMDEDRKTSTKPTTQPTTKPTTQPTTQPTAPTVPPTTAPIVTDPPVTTQPPTEPPTAETTEPIVESTNEN